MPVPPAQLCLVPGKHLALPITFYLQALKFEFHLISTSHKIFFFFGYLFRPFENVKAILGKAQGRVRLSPPTPSKQGAQTPLVPHTRKLCPAPGHGGRGVRLPGRVHWDPSAPRPAPGALTCRPAGEAGAVGWRGPAVPTLGGRGSVPGPRGGGVSAGVCL